MFKEVISGLLINQRPFPAILALKHEVYPTTQVECLGNNVQRPQVQCSESYVMSQIWTQGSNTKLYFFHNTFLLLEKESNKLVTKLI